MKEHIEKVLGLKITDEQYNLIREYYNTKEGLYLLTVNIGEEFIKLKWKTKRVGVKIRTNNWLDLFNQVKNQYPDSLIEGFSVDTRNQF